MNRQIQRCACYLDKGGTGKTTSVGHFGVALAEADHDVVLIDLAGKQGDLAKLFGLENEIDADRWPNIATVFKPQWSQVAEKLGAAAVDDLAFATDEGVDLIPAHEGLDSLDVELESNFEGREKFERLDAFIDEWLSGRYDVVLLDLPGLANNIAYNGLFAARNVLVPVEAGEFEAGQARKLREDLASLREVYDVDIEFAMLLPNKIDTRTTLAREYLEDYHEEYGDLVAPEPIPDSQDIRNAAASGQTVFALEEPSTTARRAREAYEADARELIQRLNA